MLTQNVWSTDAEMVVRNKSTKLHVLKYALLLLTIISAHRIFTTDDHFQIAVCTI